MRRAPDTAATADQQPGRADERAAGLTDTDCGRRRDRAGAADAGHEGAQLGQEAVRWV